MADTVWMIDPTGKTRGTILWTGYTAVPKFRGVGTWQVTCPLTPEHALAADRGWRIAIMDGDETVIAGPLRKARITIDGTSGRAKRSLVLQGVDDMLWLAKREAWPTPTQPLNNQTSAYDVRTGVASTVIRNYVAANAGPSATFASRRVPSLTLAADPLVGGTVTGRARFDPLLDVLEPLAIAGAVSGVELGYRVNSGFGLGKVFEVYLPVDRTGPARFSIELRNLKSLTWELVAPEATEVIAGGRGEDTARDFTSVSDSAALAAWGRLEDFFDFRSAESSAVDGYAELIQGAEARLAEQTETRSVEVQPVDTERLRYGQHYGLGDIVTVDVGFGVTIDDVIREVEITANRREGKIVRPKIGTAGTTGRDLTTSRLRDALARLGNLERNR